MNKIFLMGRLTRDPETRNTQGSNPMAIAKFTIAVDKKIKREGAPEADYFNCTSFGKQGEFVEKYLTKGTKVLVIGRVENDNYEGKDGTKYRSVQVLVEEIEFAESKNANGGSTPSDNGGNSTKAASAPSGDGFMNIPTGLEEELPFV